MNGIQSKHEGDLCKHPHILEASINGLGVAANCPAVCVGLHDRFPTGRSIEWMIARETRLHQPQQASQSVSDRDKPWRSSLAVHTSFNWFAYMFLRICVNNCMREVLKSSKRIDFQWLSCRKSVIAHRFLPRIVLYGCCTHWNWIYWINWASIAGQCVQAEYCWINTEY